jgi:hypothetical protein
MRAAEQASLVILAVESLGSLIAGSMLSSVTAK